MSEVLTFTKSSTGNGTKNGPTPATPLGDSITQVRLRSSLARKRPAAAALRPLSGLAGIPESQPPRVPSVLYSENSTDLSAGSDFYSSDSLKRSRYDSGISSLSDDSDSQSSLSSLSSDFSLGSSESSSGNSYIRPIPFVNNSHIGDFQIIGCGRDTKALHKPTNEVYDTWILTESEYTTVIRVLNRLDEAEKYYSRQDIEEMKNAVLPAKTQIVEETSGRVVLFTPIFRRTLHTFAQTRGVDVTEQELQPVFEQVIRLMAFCHSIGIMIRDLKPRKLVLDDEDRIRLHHVRDCVVLDDPSNDTVYGKVGCPAYIQPEVFNINKNGYSGKAADMWSLGVLMYLLLLGRYPFFDQVPIRVLQKIVQARVTMPTNCQISKHAKVLLYSLLRKCPAKRPTAEQLVYIPWGGAKNIPSRGSSERFLSRRIIDELLSFQSNPSESPATTPSQESRPAVSSTPQVRTPASPAPAPAQATAATPPVPAVSQTNDNDMRQLFSTARRIYNYQRENNIVGYSMRQTLAEMLISPNIPTIPSV